MMLFSPRFRLPLLTLAALSLLVAPGSCAPSDAPRGLAKAGATAGMRLQLKNVPAHGLVAQSVGLSALAKSVAPRVLTQDGGEIPSQFVPDERGSARGLLLLQLPRGGDFDLQIVGGAARQKAAEVASPFMARNAEVEMTFDTSVNGGLPSRIGYLKSGKVLEGIEWRDRLFDGREYSLRNDKNAQLETATHGAVATVVRIRVRYLDANGTAPLSQPQASYTWILWNAQPLIAVRAHLSQSLATTWQEAHTLEFQFNDTTFGSFLGGDVLQNSALTSGVPQSGALKADKTSKNFTKWGAFREGDDVFALLAPSTIYDGRGDYGTYLLLNRPAPFVPWEGVERDVTAWYFVGSDANAEKTLPPLAAQIAAAQRVVTTSNEFEKRAAALRVLAAKQPLNQRRETWWRLALANRAAQNGEQQRAENWLGKTAPADTTLHRSGDFGLALRRTEGGVRVESLFDLTQNRELLALQTPPLFNIALREKSVDAAAPGGGAASTRSANFAAGQRRLEHSRRHFRCQRRPDDSLERVAYRDLARLHRHCDGAARCALVGVELGHQSR